MEAGALKVLFTHQNCPGQFKHLATAMVRRGDEVVFITQKGKPALPGVRKLEYAPHRSVTPKIHPYLAGSEAAVLNAQAVARIGFQLRDQAVSKKGVLRDLVGYQMALRLNKKYLMTIN